MNLPVSQRRTARRVQRFGSPLEPTPHFHMLVPEAVFEELDDAESRLHPLPRPG